MINLGRFIPRLAGKPLTLNGNPIYRNICSTGFRTGSKSHEITWCTVGHAEKNKCDMWTFMSVDDQTNIRIECQDGSTVDNCISKIMVMSDNKSHISFVSHSCETDNGTSAA